MICDVHAHYTPRNFSEFMGERFASPVHQPVKRGMARHPFSGGHPNVAEAPSVTAKKFYYDTVCYGSKPAFLCALEAFGADHLVTGSDYPVLQD